MVALISLNSHLLTLILIFNSTHYRMALQETGFSDLVVECLAQCFDRKQSDMKVNSLIDKGISNFILINEVNSNFGICLSAFVNFTLLLTCMH